MNKLVEKLEAEIKELIPPTLFFLISLHVVAFIRVLMLKGTGIALSTSASVSLAALVLGKAVLLADMLPFINRFPDKPLAYNLTWKTSVYFVVALVRHYLERLVEFWRETGGLIAGNERLFAQIVWPHFWAIQILLLVLILMYCTMDEFVRVIGGDRMRHILFGPLDRMPWAQSKGDGR